MLDRNASKMLSEAGIGEGQSVLDFGCGSGTYSIPAAELVGKNGRVHSLDVSQGALEKLSNKAEKEGLDNIVTLLSSGNVDIPIDNETLNHVLLIDVLQEISDKETLLEEIHRILKPDGQMTVYPMHIDAEEVIRMASKTKLRLKGRKFQDRILVFEKS
ncbi:MAG: class I SAM-dependent methyltransferase [Candidatus Bathyarchaeota archaeon]|nr:class I SAM-dependent methyltransferase [Candidatus Bathyarchaeota archaeon]